MAKMWATEAYWHIVDDGWHYATDFSDLKKFKRKDRMGTWDYCRRQKWVRLLKKKVFQIVTHVII